MHLEIMHFCKSVLVQQYQSILPKKLMYYSRPPRRNQENYQRSQFCIDCNKIHQGSNKCRILCYYCHDFHLRKDLINNICPVMYPHARQLQQKNSYMCKNCNGEGIYDQKVQTIRRQSIKKYEERLKEWQENQKNNPLFKIARPQRKVIHLDLQEKECQCKDCDGCGRIMRMVACCVNGCSACKGDKYVVNPIWKKYRKQPIINHLVFQCSICLTDVERFAEKYVLHCRHQFHPSCIFRWMKESKKCPICRQHDLYLEGQTFKVQQQILERSQPDMMMANNSWMEQTDSIQSFQERLA